MDFLYFQPISEENKSFIENLNIEADAQMLREQLNICEEAVDYFRASSSLLKAGVAAGLTLYDIAVMCCRNDDLAEVPSMMEKLFDMASELAQIAVENERWHHTAASRALEEQLCFSSRHPQQPKCIRKSTSSMEFKSFSLSDSGNLLNLVEDSPGLVQSCASDTSSDIDDDEVTDEQEDCEKWAENVIADVSLEQISPYSRPLRSGSVSSSSSDDTSSDCGPSKGFWCVAPGAADASGGMDDVSVSWSAAHSPRNSPDLEDHETLSENDEVDESAEKSPGADDLNDNAVTPRVSFAVSSVARFHPPSTVNVSEFKALAPRRIDSGGMVRSRSFAAGLSDKDRSSKYLPCESSFFRHRSNDETFKKYFHKFIDLVIVRETSAALHNSRHGAIDAKVF